MTTLVLDNKEETILINVTEESIFNKCNFSMDLDDYYHTRLLNSDSEEEEYYKLNKPQAPPPSPEQKPMLDFFFSKKLNESLENLVEKSHDPLLQHAKVLDSLLRKTLDNKHHIKKPHCTFKKQQQKKSSYKHILKATEKIEKLKKLQQEDALSEKTTKIINELKEMGL